MLIEYSVQTPCLVLVPIDSVLDLLRCISEEVICLTLEKLSMNSAHYMRVWIKGVAHLHRPNASVQKVHPIIGFIRFSSASWVANLVLGIIFLNQVLHDRSRLEKVNSFTTIKGIGQSRDTSIGVDLKEPGLLLLLLG